MMSKLPVHSINAEELPAQDYRFVKTQQAIYNLCRDLENNSDLKSQIEQTSDLDSFLKIAAENGYEFTAADLQIAINLESGNSYLSSDEFDDYELDEEELEAVAGGGRGAFRNSYWHQTGIQVEDQCFYLLEQSLDRRKIVIEALQYMEEWKFVGNNSVMVTDLDGSRGSFLIYKITTEGAFTQNVNTFSEWEIIS